VDFFFEGQNYAILACRLTKFMKPLVFLVRHLQELVKDGTLEKLSGGLYYVPAQSTFGKVPAEEHALVERF
jgi:hypothetical protein